MIHRAVGRVSRRAQAVLWWLGGQSPSAIARRLGVSRQSVVGWCGRFCEAGVEGLADRPRSGRPPRLDAGGREKLVELLGGSDLEGTEGPGGWTTAKLAARLSAAGWAVGARTVRRWLRRLRARWRRGRLAAKGDPERATACRELAEGLLAAHLLALGAGKRLVILFEDEADLALLAHAGFSWQLIDRPAAVPTPGQNRKQGLFGSLSTEGELLVSEAARKTAAALIAHFEEAVARFPGCVLAVILDNVRIHHAKATEAWLAEHPEVRLLYLPRYSPNDNAQERVWGWLREDVCRNRSFPDLPAKLEAARNFFRGCTPAALRQRCVPERLLANLLAEAFA
jgi:transposase